MANTVSILSLANTFGEWFSSTNALARENNDLAANNYHKKSGTLFLDEYDLGLHVANNAVVGGGLQVYGTGSYGYIENNLSVDKQLYLTNTSLGLVSSGQANIGGPLYALASANGVIVSNNATVGGQSYLAGNVRAASSLIVTGSTYLANTLTVLNAANVDNFLSVSQNATIAKATITREVHANNYVWTPRSTVTQFLDVSTGTSQLHIVTADDSTASYGYINVLQSNTKINAETTNTSTLNSTRIDTLGANVTGVLNVIAGGVSNFDTTSTNTSFTNTLTATKGYIDTLQSNTKINVETVTVSTLTATQLSAPRANVSSVLDANSAKGWFGAVETQGKLTVGGDFVINGTTVYNTNTFTISAQSNNTISTLNTYRYGPNANATIRWYEPGSYWDIKDVATGTYSRIVLRSDFNDTLTSTSTTQVATARVANTLNDNFTTANTFLQAGVRSSGVYANAAFAAANNAFTAGGVVAGGYANTAFGIANSGFARANTSIVSITGTSGTATTTNALGQIIFAGSYGVTAAASGNTVTFSTPQDLRTSASPRFSGLTLQNDAGTPAPLAIAQGGTGSTSASDARTALLPRGETAGYVLTTGGQGSYYWAAGGSGGGGGSGATPGTTVQSTRSTTTATGAQTTFYAPGPFTVGASQTRIFVNGVRQYPGDYSESTLALSGVAIASTAGAFTCTSTTGLTVGRAITLIGSLTGSGTISGYFGSKTYYIIATNGTTTFTLSESVGGSAISTTTGSTTGVTFTTNYAVVLNSGVASGDSVLVEVDGFYTNPYYANNIAYTINSTISSTANTIQTAMDALASGVAFKSGSTFTGLLYAPTVQTSNNDTSVATTAYVTNKLNVGTSTTYTHSISGNAGSVTNGVYTNPATPYSDPSWLSLTKSKVGLGNVDNTSDANKSVNYASSSYSSSISGYATTANNVASWATNGNSKPSYAFGEINSGQISATSGTFTGAVTVNNTGPLFNLQDMDNRSASIHCNSATFYILRGDGTNSLTHAPYNGYWPLEINLDNNNATFGGSLTAAGNVTAYSDKKLKDKVRTIDSALQKTLALRGVYYVRFDDPNQQRVGVIAQEVQEILPEVVMKNINPQTKEETLSVDYGNITALLIEAIKELKAEVEELKGRIK